MASTSVAAEAASLFMKSMDLVENLRELRMCCISWINQARLHSLVHLHLLSTMFEPTSFP